MHTQEARINVFQTDFLLAENSEKNIFRKPKSIFFLAQNFIQIFPISRAYAQPESHK